MTGPIRLISLLNGYAVDCVTSRRRTQAVVSAAAPRLSQAWELGDDGRLTSVLTGYALTVVSDVQGADVICLPPSEADEVHQRWELDADGAVVNALRDFVLDIKGASTADGSPLIAWPRKKSNTQNQRWRVKPYAPASRRSSDSA